MCRRNIFVLLYPVDWKIVKKVLGFFAAMVTAMAVFAIAPSAAFAAEGNDDVVADELDEVPANIESDETPEGTTPEGDAPLDEGGENAGDSDEEPAETPVLDEVVSVTVEAPTKVVEPCRPPLAEQRWVKIAPVEGVQFYLNGEPVDASAMLIPVYSNEALVKAVALEGFVIEGETEWFIPFDFKECLGSDIVLPPLDMMPCVYGCEPPYDIVILKPELGEAAVIDRTQELPEATTVSVSGGAMAPHPEQLAVTGMSDTTLKNGALALGAILLAAGGAYLCFGLPDRMRGRARKE